MIHRLVRSAAATFPSRLCAIFAVTKGRPLPTAVRHRALSRAEILDRVWNYGFGGKSSIVDLYISYLRKKIDNGREPMIHTLRGAGYVLKPAP